MSQATKLGARRVLLLLSACALLACDESATEPDNGPRLIVVGYLEAGGPVAARAVRGADTVDVSFSALNFPAPANVVLLTADNEFSFLSTGTFVVRATLPDTTLSTTVNIVAAPAIIFDASVNGNRDIYRTTLYGMDLERLTTDLGVDVDPTWAKSTLIYTSYRNGNGELYSHPVGGSPANDVRLTTTVANETDAALSPDALHLAYVRDDGNTPRVFVAGPVNAGAAALTAGTAPSAVEGSPSWRFTSDSLLIMSTSLGNASIFRAARTAGSTPASAAQPVTTDSVYVEPSWSPDGSRIAYAAAAVGGASRIAVRNRVTGTSTYVTPATISAGQPAFLLDGRIVFTIFGSGGLTGLAWVDPSTPGSVHSITLAGTNPQHPAIIWP